MGIKLAAASGGSVELVPTNTASNFTATMPAVTGNVVLDSATQTLTNKTIQGGAITSGTAVASTSGTSIDFTSIPSWVKRITVMFNGISNSGTANPLIQIGAGSVTSSGYVANSTYAGNSGTGGASSTAGFILFSSNASNVVTGHLVITLVGSNLWVSSHSLGVNTAGTIYCIAGGGAVTLGGTLDRLRITTSNGTDTFDAGSINILYE